jgi:opacity protein-like surface antigen
MKNIYLLLATTLLISTGAVAQETEVATRFGIKLAPNLSWMRSDTRGLQNDGNRLGYSVGLMAEFPVGATGNYRFASGLFLTTTGGHTAYQARIEYPLFVSNITARNSWSLRYVELPLTIKMMTNEIGYLRYYGQLGVTGGVNIRARSNIEVIRNENEVITTINEDNIDVQDDVQLLRAALVIGGGVEYNFSGQTTLLIGITYNNGIMNVMRRDALEGFDRPRVYADYLELTLGIFF